MTIPEHSATPNTMGGTNPYIETAKTDLPESKYTITFLVEGEGEPHSQVVEVDPSQLPTSRTGLPGSILDIALASGIEIDHACGGVCACSTCHIIVQEGLESCNSSTDDEEDQLEKAPGLTPNSRLGCQCVPNGSRNLKVKVPNWNRNLISEKEL